MKMKKIAVDITDLNIHYEDGDPVVTINNNTFAVVSMRTLGETALMFAEDIPDLHGNGLFIGEDEGADGCYTSYLATTAAITEIKTTHKLEIQF